MKFISNTDYFITLDPELTIVSYSKNIPTIWEDLYGVPIREKANIIDFIPENSLSSFLEIFANCLHGEFVLVEKTIQFPKKETYLIQAALNPVMVCDEVNYVQLCVKNNSRHREILKHQKGILASYADLTSQKLRVPLSNIFSLSGDLDSAIIREPRIIKSLLDDIIKQAEVLDMMIYGLKRIITNEEYNHNDECELEGNEYRKIILIDDDSIGNKIHAKLFENYCPSDDFRIFTGPGDALNYLQNHSVDIILINIASSGFSAWDFFEALPENKCRRFIVAIVSQNDISILDQALRYPGIAHFFLKPLTKEHLQQMDCL